MICDEDLPRVCPDQSLLRLLLRQKARLNLTNRCGPENPKPRQALEVDPTLVRESDKEWLKLVGLKSTLLQWPTRAWTCQYALSHPSWLMGKEESMDPKSKLCETTRREKSQPCGDSI